MIRPIGMAVFLVLFVVFMVLSFNLGKDPLGEYESPESSEYYARNGATLMELQDELEANVFPGLEGVKGSYVDGKRLKIYISPDKLASTRSAILQYFDAGLFEFVEG